MQILHTAVTLLRWEARYAIHPHVDSQISENPTPDPHYRRGLCAADSQRRGAADAARSGAARQEHYPR